MLPAQKACQYKPGFTLAELLIALAILGVIAAFTIPKILSAQTNSKYVALAKEAASMISGAYQQAKLANTVTSSTTPADLTPYLNHVSIDTSSTLVDATPDASSIIACSASNPCLMLHNGAILQLLGFSFAGTNTTNAIEVRLDPQGNSSGTADSIQFELYYNGQFTTRGNARTASANSNNGNYGPNSAYDPSWLQW